MLNVVKNSINLIIKEKIKFVLLFYNKIVICDVILLYQILSDKIY